MTKTTYLYLLPDCRDKTINDCSAIGFTSSKMQLKAYNYHHTGDGEHQLQCYISTALKTKISNNTLVYRISKSSMILLHTVGNLGNDMFLITNEINDDFAEDVFQSLYYRQPGSELMLYE